MGMGGNMPVNASKKLECNLIKRVPCTKPSFTLGQIKKAIPPHCFQRSVIRSFSYVFFDLSIALLFYHTATNYFPNLPHPLSYLAWPFYWALQGCVLTGVWVVAHECGHQAFSNYQWLNDAVGLVLHSFLLVPYFSWKHSHRRHHSNTSSLDHDEVFVPKKKCSIRWYARYTNNPPGRLLILIMTLSLGWPLYLAFNVSGRPYERFACHYDPYGPIYTIRERTQIFISDSGVLAVAYALYHLASVRGLVWILLVYGGPLLVVNAFLVTITYLQHTHPSLPHYDSSQWDWLRGALATVDRDFGVLNKIFHHITDTHVAHHLFSTLPHYHAVEATRVIKPILGEYYQFDSTPIHMAIWREAKECVYVVEDEVDKNNGVFWYQNKF